MSFAILPPILLAVSSLASAAPVFDASYGDKDGCHYARTGESSGSDTFFLLNDEGVTTSTAMCSFVGRPKAKSDGFEGKMSCESEGEVGDPEAVNIRKSAKGYTVSFADGTRWGPLPKCR